MESIQYRQGDVFLERVAKAKVGAKIPRTDGRIVLAYGEVTGHAHAIVEDDAALYDGAEKALEDRFLKVFKPVMLRHEEHAPIELVPGVYRVRRQREWTDSDEPRVVAD